MARYSVYLAGPVTGEILLYASDWRDMARTNLRAYDMIETVSPLRHKVLPDEGPIPDSDESDPLNSRRGIYARCRADVLRSDLVLANFAYAQTRVSIGTVMEVTWAKEWDIPVIAFIDSSNKSYPNPHWHNMLRETFDFVVPTLSQALDLIPRILLPDDAF